MAENKNKKDKISHYADFGDKAPKIPKGNSIHKPSVCPRQVILDKKSKKSISGFIANKKVSHNSTSSKFMNLLGIAVFSTLIFIFLSLPSVDQIIAYFVPDNFLRLLTKALIFFAIIYLADLIILNARHPKYFYK